MMYEGEDVNTIDLLCESETTEGNGVKVIVPVKYSDYYSFKIKFDADLMQLTDQLLQLARASQQSRAGQLQMDDMDLVAEVCLPLQQAFDWYSDLHMEWHLPEHAYCVASAPLLQIALKNLIENARKYAGERPEIEVSVVAEQNEWVLRVCDNGPGVAPELLGQLTDSFFRADQVKQGYGLGLSIVKRITDLHQADLQLTNLAGSGLQVAFRLKRVEALVNVQ